MHMPTATRGCRQIIWFSELTRVGLTRVYCIIFSISYHWRQQISRFCNHSKTSLIRISQARKKCSNKQYIELSKLYRKTIFITSILFHSLNESANPISNSHKHCSEASVLVNWWRMVLAKLRPLSTRPWMAAIQFWRHRADACIESQQNQCFPQLLQTGLWPLSTRS